MVSLIFDDTDATIDYSTGDWDRAGGDREFNSTTTWTNTEGATATIQFIGTRISVHGTIAAGLRATGARSSYVVDDNDPVVFEAEPSIAVQYNQVFFQSPILDAGQHTLTITNIGDDDRDQLFLDLMIVEPLETPFVTTVTSTVTQSATAIPASTLTVTSTVTPTSAGNNAAEGAQQGTGAVRSEGNPAAIAGGVIGGILALLLIVAGIFFYKKRTSKKKTDDSFWISPNSNVQPTLTPFPPPATTPASPQMAQSSYGGGYPSRQQGYPNQSAPSQYPQSGSELAYYSPSGAGEYQQPYQNYNNYSFPSVNQPPPAGRVRVNLNDPTY